jgi:hypothetical protein
MVWGLCRRFPGRFPHEVKRLDTSVLRMFAVLDAAGELDPPQQQYPQAPDM